MRWRKTPGLKAICWRKQIPKDAYYGVQTHVHWKISMVSGVTTKFYPDYVQAYAMVKLAAARANTDVGRMKKEKLDD